MTNPLSPANAWPFAPGGETPTVEECEAAGRGPTTYEAYTEGGLPDTPEERARFEAYMRGHCWSIGNYDEEIRAYDTVIVRMLYGVWRDRGAIAARSLAAAHAKIAELERDGEPVAWRWKAKDATLWIYDPDDEWMKKQGDSIDTEALYTTPQADAHANAKLARLRELAKTYINAANVFHIADAEEELRAELEKKP